MTDLGVMIDPADANFSIPAIEEMSAFDQWVAWRYVQRPGAVKPTKPPVNPHNGFGASHSDPKTWSSFKKAEARAKRDNLPGTGFVLTAEDEFVGIDLDACRDSETGQVEPWAQAIIDLGETYTEVSPSGTGIRMIARGELDKAVKHDPAHVEIYDRQRYLTITSWHIAGTPEDIREAPATIEALIARVEAMRPKPEPRVSPASSAPGAGFTPRASDGKHGSGSTFFRAVNDRALANIGAWALALFPRAIFQPGTGAWRVPSKSLGRHLQEDLSISPEGAVDFGVADMGDPNQGKRTAIDLVMEWGGAPDATAAARWLCEHLGVTPESLGWQDNSDVDRIGEAVASKLEQGDDEAPRETVIVDGVTIDAETGDVIDEDPGTGDSFRSEEAPRADASQKASGPRAPVLETINAASLAGKPVPLQRWIVEGLIPENNVAMLSGDGATGKSLLALQLAVAVATGGDWIGFKPQPGRAVFVSAEDEIDELHRRLDRMVPRLESLEQLTLVPLAGKDAVLAAPMGRDGLLRPTPIFTALRHIIEAHCADLLILDTLADLFGGDELKKVHARQFIAMLRGLALECDVTILLLSHPSQAGLSTGTGTSGNVAWNNSVRSRLYFERRVNRFDGSEDDADIRVLTTKKSNRAASGGMIVVRYSKGAFIREIGNDLDARDANQQAERVFLSLLAQFEREGRPVSDRPSSTFAPTVFATHPNASGISKGAFHKAMDRLFETAAIKVVETGPLSRRRRKIALADSPEQDDVDGVEGDGPSEGGGDDAY